MKDLYNILNIHKDATSSQVKKSYRKLAHEYHPDKNPNNIAAEDRFKEITEAYDVLSDSSKRKRYDQLRAIGFKPGLDIGQNLGEIFEDLFGDFFGRKKSPQQNTGRNKTVNITIDLRTAVNGGGRDLDLTRISKCRKCKGTGSEKDADLRLCHACGGVGELRVKQGMLSVSKRCSYCVGKGRITAHNCVVCDGEGVTEITEQLKVKIPPGADTGTLLRYANKGDLNFAGGRPGDLKVHITVEPHPLFSREGLDLHCEIPVPFTKLILGGSIEIPTIDKPVIMKIPPETPHNKVFRLRGKGVPQLNKKSKRGDLQVQLKAEMPVNYTSNQRALVNQLRELETSSNYPQIITS